MMEFLGALVVIGIFVCWCDLTDSWSAVLRPVHALLWRNAMPKKKAISKIRGGVRCDPRRAKKND